MKKIKRFTITYQEGKSVETREWPGHTPEHATKRFQRSRELANQAAAILTSVVEIATLLPEDAKTFKRNSSKSLF